MSKGFGRQQDRILAALDKRPAFYLAELCESGTCAEHVSLLRAASRLYDAGQIRHSYVRLWPPTRGVMRRGYRLLNRPEGGELLKC
jgi:hypothetical protein